MADREPIRIINVGPDPEQARRAELRSDFLVPIYLMWSSDVLPVEAQAAVRGVFDAVNASGQKREVVTLGSTPWSKGDYSSADWYLNKALSLQSENRNKGHGQQVNVLDLVNQFYDEPWQEKPHWEVSIVNMDLFTPETNFVFGVTRPEFAASVQSIRRFMDSIPSGELRNEMIRRILRHELGHMFGLPGRDFKVEEKLGSHCTNVCTMRQGMSIPEWANLTKEENQGKVHFCNDCINVLAKKRDQLKPLPRT